MLSAVVPIDEKKKSIPKPPEMMTKKERERLIRSLEKEMRDAARRLEFEQAAELRDALMEIRAANS